MLLIVYLGEGKTKPFSLSAFKPETKIILDFCFRLFLIISGKDFKRIFEILVKIL
ncbi:predicted protein [Enterococcus faecalis HIP11704]|nr:predicted protein [Enterococcus faecalis HIP11704]